MAAKEVVYPLYWDTVGPPPARGKLDKQVVDFESRLAQMTKFKAATEAFQQMYCRQVARAPQEVILRGKPIAGINAARMMAAIPERRLERGVLQGVQAWADEVQPRLADGNAEYMAGLFLSLLGDPKVNDGVKYYALRGLGSLVGLPKQTPPLLKQETEEKAIQTATRLVEKKTRFPKATPRGEVEGYKILRREAVKVLAQCRTPIVGKERPALILAKVAGNDQGIVPSPRLDAAPRSVDWSGADGGRRREVSGLPAGIRGVPGCPRRGGIRHAGRRQPRRRQKAHQPHSPLEGGCGAFARSAGRPEDECQDGHGPERRQAVRGSAGADRERRSGKRQRPDGLAVAQRAGREKPVQERG